MTESWFECVEPETPLTQGDFVLSCPVLVWKEVPEDGAIEGNGEELATLFEIIAIDAIVVSQSCDLEQGKVDDVLVCPMYVIDEFKEAWAEDQRAKGQQPTDKAWRRYCEDIRNGYVWSHAMLNSGSVAGVETPHRIVDFHDIYTLPKTFLSATARRAGRRLRLLPPYREHLSQAFARYFMRVGLPTPIAVAW